MTLFVPIILVACIGLLAATYRQKPRTLHFTRSQPEPVWQWDCTQDLPYLK